ncbi:MAG TPA: cytochrome c biogenesis protein CcdA [Candidatus Portnoybacteria bacterium]|nr:cytochrome c biogenesis protein CcdA [Candidatus Portnoybacteria bacterium]
MIPEISFSIALLAGFLSFISPCILPLLPSYLGYLSGLSLSNGYRNLAKPQLRLKLFINSLLFVFGFSLIFILLGATASLLGQLLLPVKLILQRIGGGLIIIFGLYLAGLFKIPFLGRERRLKLPASLRKLKYLGSFLVGLTFAFGWIACIGPILVSILVLASLTVSLNQGIVLLGAYSLGLAIPFLLTSLFITSVSAYIRRFSRFSRFISIFSGGLLVILGLLLLSNDFYKIVAWFYNLYNSLGIPLY